MTRTLHDKKFHFISIFEANKAISLFSLALTFKYVKSIFPHDIFNKMKEVSLTGFQVLLK